MTFLWAQLESDWIRLLFNITKRRILGSILKLQVVVSLGNHLNSRQLGMPAFLKEYTEKGSAGFDAKL
ncbi:hypothetical protein M514_07534 [Trichuris suis]|uniref:Uncharacterized protein n=1 Tax=Trichuris suis TaxID=68888 RepID=A0A085NEA5_9BILA|nr:hypothetical protein M514_07534 [Trichuris suis]